MWFRKHTAMDVNAKVELEGVRIWLLRWVAPSKQDIIDRSEEVVNVKAFTDREGAEYYLESMNESLKNINSQWKLNATIKEGE